MGSRRPAPDKWGSRVSLSGLGNRIDALLVKPGPTTKWGVMPGMVDGHVMVHALNPEGIAKHSLCVGDFIIAVNGVSVATEHAVVEQINAAHVNATPNTGCVITVLRPPGLVPEGHGRKHRHKRGGAYPHLFSKWGSRDDSYNNCPSSSAGSSYSDRGSLGSLEDRGSLGSLGESDLERLRLDPESPASAHSPANPPRPTSASPRSSKDFLATPTSVGSSSVSNTSGRSPALEPPRISRAVANAIAPKRLPYYQRSSPAFEANYASCNAAFQRSEAAAALQGAEGRLPKRGSRSSARLKASPQLESPRCVALTKDPATYSAEAGRQRVAEAAARRKAAARRRMQGMDASDALPSASASADSTPTCSTASLPRYDSTTSPESTTTGNTETSHSPMREMTPAPVTPPRRLSGKSRKARGKTTQAVREPED